MNQHQCRDYKWIGVELMSYRIAIFVRGSVNKKMGIYCGIERGYVVGRNM